MRRGAGRGGRLSSPLLPLHGPELQERPRVGPCPPPPPRPRAGSGAADVRGGGGAVRPPVLNRARHRAQPAPRAAGSCHRAPPGGGRGPPSPRRVPSSTREGPCTARHGPRSRWVGRGAVPSTARRCTPRGTGPRLPSRSAGPAGPRVSPRPCPPPCRGGCGEMRRLLVTPAVEISREKS